MHILKYCQKFKKIARECCPYCANYALIVNKATFSIENYIDL